MVHLAVGALRAPADVAERNCARAGVASESTSHQVYTVRVKKTQKTRFRRVVEQLPLDGNGRSGSWIKFSALSMCTFPFEPRF